MSSTPLGTRSLKIKIGSTEYNVDITDCEIVSAAADGSLQTFAAAATGGARLYTLKFTCTQDPADSTSIWTKVFSSAGSTVAVMINPYGGVGTLSATNPGISGNLVITEPNGTLLGGQADPSAIGRFTMDLAWDFTAKPTLVTTGTY